MNLSFQIEIEDYTYYGNGYCISLDTDGGREVMYENLTKDQIKEKLNEIAKICITRFCESKPG